MDTTRGVDVGGHGPHLGNKAQSELRTDFWRLRVEQKEANHDQGVDGCESWLPRFELPDTVLAIHNGAIQGLFVETKPPVLAGPVLQRRADFLHNHHHDLVWIHFLEHGTKRATQQNAQNVMGVLMLP